MDHFALFLLASLIVGASKGGLTTAGALAVPLLSIWVDPLVAAGILLPVFLASDVVGVWLFRREFSTKNVLLLVPAGIIGVGLATLIAPYVSTNLLTLATGIIGFVFCLQSAAKRLRQNTKAAEFNWLLGGFWGCIAGITSFISHTGGPPYQVFVLPQRLPKMDYAGTTTIVFAAVNLAKLPAYTSIGLMSSINWTYMSVMIGVACAGAVLGRWVSKLLSQNTFMLIIEVLLFILSVYLIGISITRM